jgi:hypothetical protein
LVLSLLVFDVADARGGNAQQSAFLFLVGILTEMQREHF